MSLRYLVVTLLATTVTVCSSCSNKLDYGKKTYPVTGRVYVDGGSPRATRKELHGFLDHLEEGLEAGGYFRVEAMRPGSVRSLRNIFTRAELTEQEVRTLHGVVTALVGVKRELL